MTDWVSAFLFFLAVINPAVLVLLLSRAGDRRFDREVLVQQFPGFVGALIALVSLALLSDPILDLLDLSLSTFQIATGALVVFGAFQAFLALGVEPREVSTGWANVGLLIWMISPAPVALAISIAASDGFGFAATALVAASVAALLLAAGWGIWQGLEHRSILGWIRRVVAAAAVLAAVDLIRQGVENV